MPIICHVADEHAGWEQRVGIGQLLERLPTPDAVQHLWVLSPIARAQLSGLKIRATSIPRPADINLLAAPALRREFERKRIDVIHAWGPSAAAAARAASGIPMVVELFHPRMASEGAKILRSIARPRGFAVLCAAQWVRRRAIEHGVPPECCVVIRPGVDFAAIRRYRASPLRASLGVSADDYLIVLNEAGGHGGDHGAAFWASSLLNHLEGHCKVIVPGSPRVVQRLARFEKTLPSPRTMIAPGDAVAFEEIIAVSDALVVPQSADSSTTAVAWAMASGTAVIAAAGYAVTELIVTKVNGLLYKHTEGKPASIRIMQLLKDRPSQRKTSQTAHGQAYEVFGLRRSIEQHMRVYQNVLSGVPPAEGIADAAQIG